VINSLGLFAVLGSPDGAAPPPAPAEDPAVFAAALIAALGLQAPVQETTVVAAPPTDAAPEPGTDEAEAEPADGEEFVVPTTDPEPPVDGKVARPVVARVTPDPEMVKETATLGAMLRGQATVEKGGIVDRVSAEPAAPVKREAAPTAASPEANTPCVMPPPLRTDGASTDTAKEAPSAASDTITLAVKDSATLETEPVIVQPPPVVAQAKATGATAEAASDHPVATDDSKAAPVTSRSRERRGARVIPEADLPPEADRVVAGLTPAPRAANIPAPLDPSLVAPLVAPMAAAPVIAADAPVRVEGDGRDIPPAPVPPAARPSAAVPVMDVAPPGRAVADAAREIRVTNQAPPQSVEERTARAMAENHRVERQLVELLGDADVKEFRIQFGRRPAAAQQAVGEDPLAASRAPAGKVVWQRAEPVIAGDIISTGVVTPRVKIEPAALPGTLVHEARLAEVPTAPLPLQATPPRSEIVGMVANASRAMAPNIVATEGAPVESKAPVPSMVQSLPVVRQELPDAEPRRVEPSGQDPKRARARAADASDTLPSGSAVAANYSSPAGSRSSPPETREGGEARNLPSHGSTDPKPAGSADRVTLQVADDEGRQTRIQVSVTGNQVRAVITPPDNASVRQLEQRMDQLHETLVRQGFVDPKVVVRAAPEAATDAALLAGSSQDGRSTVPAGKEQPAGEQRQGRGQREQDRGDGHRHPQGHSRGRDPRDRRR
jgi:hypothetical protein